MTKWGSQGCLCPGHLGLEQRQAWPPPGADGKASQIHKPPHGLGEVGRCGIREAFPHQVSIPQNSRGSTVTLLTPLPPQGYGNNPCSPH